MNEERETHYRKTASWAVDEQTLLRRMLRQARVIAGAAVLVAILEGFALILLTPLKTVTPIPILVDRQTGFVEVLNGTGRREVTANAALIQSLLAQYVIARESFDITDVAAQFHKVALWSGGAARRDYLRTMPASNPESPFRLYPRSTIVDTRVKSVSPIGPKAALVRFETRRQDQDDRVTARRSWAAVVAYRFVDAPMSVADRLTNPLGFQVVRYHRDAEAIYPPDTAETPAPVSPPPAVSSPNVTGPAPSPPAPPPSLGVSAPPVALPPSTVSPNAPFPPPFIRPPRLNARRP